MVHLERERPFLLARSPRTLVRTGKGFVSLDPLFLTDILISPSSAFFMRRSADCLSNWIGEAERPFRLLFEEAQYYPFDDIDGLAPVGSSEQDRIHASLDLTLLTLMDGMDCRGQVRHVPRVDG